MLLQAAKINGITDALLFFNYSVYDMYYHIFLSHFKFKQLLCKQIYSLIEPSH